MTRLGRGRTPQLAMLLYAALAAALAAAAAARGLSQVPAAAAPAAPAAVPVATLPAVPADAPAATPPAAPAAVPAATPPAAPAALPAATPPAAPAAVPAAPATPAPSGGAYYFPLLASNLSAAAAPAGVGPFVGVGANVVWEQDPLFGPVLTCSEAAQSHVVIPGLQYGTAGPFGLAVWAKLSPQGNTSMDYIYSHANLFVTQWAFDPNEVALFVPEQNHPDFGVVRALVRDSTDVATNGTDIPMYLDSNGCVSDPTCAAPGNASLFSTPGSWHLLGLTTRPEGGKGFQLYVDGQLAAAVEEGALYPDPEGFQKTATGGAPMNLTGNITLCGRADLSPSRFFTGSLAHLFIWDRAVTADEMRLIYERGAQVQGGDAAMPPSPALPISAGSIGDVPQGCTTPCEDNGGGLITCRASTGELIVCPGTTVPASEPPGVTGAAGAAGTTPTDAQPATDCVTSCASVQGIPICFTLDSQPRPCTPGTGSSGIAPGSTDPSSAAAPLPAATPAAAPAAAPVSEPSTVVITPVPAPAPAPGGAPAAPAVAAAQLGGHPLCSSAPLQGIVTQQDCGQGYVCAPLSQQQLAVNFGAQLPLKVGDIGVCAYAPGGMMLPSAAQVPPPMAFFPLSSQTLESFPLPDYSAVSSTSSVGIVQDPVFGAVLQCNAGDSDMVGLSPVQYARSGAFSVNVWFKPGVMPGPTMAYLFSHRGTDANSTATSNTGWGPNQVQMFLPRRGHPAYGVVRTYVKDYNDGTNGTWLDSDGTIALAGGPRLIPPSLSPYNGSWHMATVTSQPGGPGTKGYRLYLDGRLAAELADGTSYYNPQGQPIQIDGGDPILLDGNPVLCARSDDPTGRHFDGQLAYLSMYDVALDETQVGLLYSQVAAKLAAAPPPPPAGTAPATPELPVFNPQGSAPNATRYGVSGQECVFPALWNGEVVTDCVDIQGTLQCQVASGGWEPCAGGAPSSESPASGAAAGGSRFTVEGQECVFPATFAGLTVTDCIRLQPGEPAICQTATGQWQPCADAGTAQAASPSSEKGQGALTGGGSIQGATVPALSGGPGVGHAPIFTTHGTQCMLPLQYHGVKVDSCLNMDGEYLCWGTDTNAWEACPDGFAAETPDTQGASIDAAAATLLVVPHLSRNTTAGDPCVLPTVWSGEILDDCVQRGGTWSCLTSNGTWAACDLGADQPPNDQPGQLWVAQRWSVTGKPCLFPAVYNALFFDCVEIDTGNGTIAEACPNVDGVWEACGPAVSPLSSLYAAPKLFRADETLARASPGKAGMVCSSSPTHSLPSAGCTANLTCVPMPEGLGFCQDDPVGGTKGVPFFLETTYNITPLALFPLTGGSLDSLLLPAYSGVLLGTPPPNWVADPTFGAVVNCSRDSQSAVALDPVPYAADGPFAVSLWMRRLPGADMKGPAYSYLYSHIGGGRQRLGQSANTVALYLPNSGNPTFGTVRAIVSDSNDASSELVYLESDGTVGTDTVMENGTRPLQHADLNDGGWHMITVSTLPDGSRGFALYVDGAQMAALNSSSVGPDGSPVQPTGGDPADLTSRIFLCARYDGDGLRFYDGSIAHVSLFNKALGPDQVAGLYQAYVTNGTGGPTTGEAASGNPQGDPEATISSGGLTTSEIVGIVLASLGGAVALATLGVLGVGYARRRKTGKSFERFNDDPAAAAAAEAGGGALPRELSVQLSGAQVIPIPGSVPGAGPYKDRHQLPRYQSALSDVSTEAASNTSGLPRMPTAHSGVPLMPAAIAGQGAGPGFHRTPSLARGGAPAGAPVPVQDSAFASVAGSAAGGDGSDDAASMATAQSEQSGATGVTVEPGRRGLFRSGGARVVLQDPRSPYEP